MKLNKGNTYINLSKIPCLYEVFFVKKISLRKNGLTQHITCYKNILGIRICYVVLYNVLNLSIFKGEQNKIYCTLSKSIQLLYIGIRGQNMFIKYLEFVSNQRHSYIYIDNTLKILTIYDKR